MLHARVANVCKFCLDSNTVQPRFNEPLCNEVLGITNDIFQLSNSVMYGKEPRYKEPISPVPWRFHRTCS